VQLSSVWDSTGLLHFYNLNVVPCILVWRFCLATHKVLCSSEIHTVFSRCLIALDAILRKLSEVSKPMDGSAIERERDDANPMLA
jgi:hypothetical protein